MTGGPSQYFISDGSIIAYVKSRVLLQIGCREQMRFQLSFESLSVCSSFSVYWQLIPDAWCSDGEGTFAKLQSRPLGDQVIVRSSARYWRRRFNQVFEVGGMWVLVHWWSDDKQAELEFNPLLNWQTMEISEYE